MDNLLDNAIRVAPPGSTVAVMIEPGDPHHRITISDNGPGIPDDNKPLALTRFWRADTSTPGTGLGLAICDAIITAGNGSLRLDDTRPTGLTVTIEVAAETADRRLRASDSRLRTTGSSVGG